MKEVPDERIIAKHMMNKGVIPFSGYGALGLGLSASCFFESNGVWGPLELDDAFACSLIFP